MRARHTPHALPAFPVYSSAFLSDNELVLGGGGGASRSGIKNKLRLYHIGDDRSLDLVDELELQKGEDAPMSMAAHMENRQLVCGINSSMEKLEKGQNDNCRVYGFKGKKFSPLTTRGTLTSGDTEDYQKVTVFSPDGTLIVAAGTRNLSLLRYPSLSPSANPISVENGEIYDVTFSSCTLVVATSVNLLVYNLPQSTSTTSSPKRSRRKGKQKEKPIADLELMRTVELPVLPGGIEGSTFRAARFHPQNDKILYAIVNVAPPRSRKTKSTPRQAFLCKWNTETWDVPSKVRKIGDRGLTCFDVSANGKFLAFGSSDYTIGLLDASTLSPLLTILKAHEFPPTTLRFNPSSTFLVSGSADNSVRIVSVPDSMAGASWTMTILIIITLLIVLLAIAGQLFLHR